MSDIYESEAAIYGVVAGVLLFIGFLVGRAFGVDDLKQQAVSAGHAEWGADQSGKPQFKWKEAKP